MDAERRRRVEGGDAGARPVPHLAAALRAAAEMVAASEEVADDRDVRLQLLVHEPEGRLAAAWRDVIEVLQAPDVVHTIGHRVRLPDGTADPVAGAAVVAHNLRNVVAVARRSSALRLQRLLVEWSRPGPIELVVDHGGRWTTAEGTVLADETPALVTLLRDLDHRRGGG